MEIAKDEYMGRDYSLNEKTRNRVFPILSNTGDQTGWVEYDSNGDKVGHVEYDVNGYTNKE